MMPPLLNAALHCTRIAAATNEAWISRGSLKNIHTFIGNHKKETFGALGSVSSQAHAISASIYSTCTVLYVQYCYSPKDCFALCQHSSFHSPLF